MRINASALSVGGIFVVSTLLAGCKHPLAIQGQGDIVDVNNSGYGCTLEQFQARDTACTENEVSGDYIVNYRAQPRPGWRFLRWEGPCAPDSDFQHCRVEAPAEAVAAWDENYSDFEIPPSTAIFQAIAGETGYLAGPAVAGVSYTTPTHQGVTGIDGSFQYEEGETVRFAIGDTPLGDVIGKTTVTPFDLADSPVLRGFEINRVMEGEDRGFPYRMTLYPRGQEQALPFHILTNIAVLLQSLDQDADASNGIMIRPGVAVLLSQVRLNVQQGWEQFSASLEFRHLLARANRRKRFSDPHGAVNPAMALQALYDSLDIDAKIVGEARMQWDEHGEYPTDYTTTADYDESGYRVVQERFVDDGQLEAMDIWAYDELGNMTSHEQQDFDDAYSETRQYDTRGNLVQETDSGNPGGIVSYTYDEYDSVTRRESDENGDGLPEMIDTWSYQYDVAGKPVQERWDQLDDGSLEAIVNYQYDSDGRLLRLEGLVDLNADGTHEPGYSREYQYDEAGNLIRDALFWGRLRSPGRISHYSYDADGNLTREAVDSDGDGSLDNLTSFAYDDSGGLIRQESDWDADGTTDAVHTWQNQYEYDADGKLTRKLADEHGDGLPNEIISYAYHPNGELATEELWNQSSYRYTSSWQYDAQGRVTREVEGPNVTTYSYNNRGFLARRESYEEMGRILGDVDTWQYDVRGYPIRHKRNLATAETWQYDDNGRLTRYTRGREAPYPWSAGMVATLEYHSSGQLLRRAEALDTNFDGIADGHRLWQYNRRGNLTRYERRGESEGWGYDYDPEQVAEYNYDASNRLVREEITYLQEGSSPQTVIYKYDANGKLIRRTHQQGGDGSAESFDTWTYNDWGKLSQHEENRDGQTDTETWEYDSQGKLLSHSGDWGADGSRDYIETFEYDANGYLLNWVSDQISYENTVTREFEHTGWGHITHPMPE